MNTTTNTLEALKAQQAALAKGTHIMNKISNKLKKFVICDENTDPVVGAEPMFFKSQKTADRWLLANSDDATLLAVEVDCEEPA